MNKNDVQFFCVFAIISLFIALQAGLLILLGD